MFSNFYDLIYTWFKANIQALQPAPIGAGGIVPPLQLTWFYKMFVEKADEAIEKMRFETLVKQLLK